LYDTGNYEATLAEALRVADVAGFQGRKADAARRASCAAGYCCYIEACGIAPRTSRERWARAPASSRRRGRVHPTGKVTVFTGSHSTAGTRDHFRAGGS